MMNKGYAKTRLHDKNGNTLLPQTTASMVSEEPDRRFVDRVEKSLLSQLSDDREALEALSEKSAELIMLADNAEIIVPGSELQEALVEISENMAALQQIADNIENIIAISNNKIQLVSQESDKIYSLEIDDSSGAPEIKLTEITNPSPNEDNE